MNNDDLNKVCEEILGILQTKTETPVQGFNCLLQLVTYFIVKSGLQSHIKEIFEAIERSVEERTARWRE